MTIQIDFGKEIKRSERRSVACEDCEDCDKVTEHIVRFYEKATFYWCQVCGDAFYTRRPQQSERTNQAVDTRPAASEIE